MDEELARLATPERTPAQTPTVSRTGSATSPRGDEATGRGSAAAAAHRTDGGRLTATRKDLADVQPRP